MLQDLISTFKLAAWASLVSPRFFYRGGSRRPHEADMGGTLSASFTSMTDTANEIQSEMAATRDRMADDVNELKAKAAARMHAAKERVNVTRIVREHPWSALSAAVVLGAAIGASGADEKAAAATVAGAKKAAGAAKDAAGAAKDAATSTIEKLHSSEAEVPEPPHEAEVSKPGLSDRVSVMLGALVMRGLDRVLDEMRAASRQWGTRMASPSRTDRPPRAATPVPPPSRPEIIAVREEIATSQTAAETEKVPVPNEMLPTEVGLRADAVEALGGGTHEPPLEPGAGELGARWS